MKNENVPEIEQTLHERLCAYVFGELQGAERTAFEAELFQSPLLQAEHARLTATIGLVKRAVPDEGLPSEVRREILASARRSRFRVLRGRGLMTVAAAALLLVSAAFALRFLSGRGLVSDFSPKLEVLDDTRIAKREAPSSLVERRGAEVPGETHPAGAPAAAEPPRVSDEVAETLAPEELGRLRDLGYAGGESGDKESSSVDALGIRFQYDQVPPLAAGATTFNGGSAGSALTLPTTIDAGNELAQSFGVLTAGQSAPATPAKAGALGQPRGAQGSRQAGKILARLNESLRAQRLEGGRYRGPGDSVPPGGRREPASEPQAAALVPPARQAGMVVTDGKAPVDPAQSGAVQLSLEGLGYGGQAEPRDELEALGYIGEDERELKGEADGTAFFRVSGAERRLGPPVSQGEIETLTNELLGECGLLPGETPRDMFFRYWGDSPFVLTQDEKTSTFAVDVDTASYALARSYLNQGRLPPREAVRTEEFVNYFKSDQPAPTNGDPFAIGIELAPSPFAKDARTELLRVTVRGKDVENFQRQPVALTFVIDNSGSMNEGGRLELVKRSLALLLRELYSGDSVAVVKFSNEASVVSPMVSSARRGELEGLIQALPIEGGTNVEAGLRLGYEVAVQSLARNAVNRVILCSDGVGNIGETSAKGLLELVKESRAKGVYLNTVGVGMGNHDDAFLEQLADQGDGVCNYVDGDAEARRVFVDGLAKALQPIARDVKIQVEFDPTQVEGWRLLGYENRALRNEDFKDDRVDAGEVNAGHQVTALYELVRNPRAGGALATVRLRYKPPFAIDRGDEGVRAKAEAEKALEIERSLHASSVLPGFAAASDGFKCAALVAQFAEVLRQSVHARGDSFGRLLEEARTLERTLADPDVAEFVALLGKANPLLDARAKQETPRLEQWLDDLARLRYEQGQRERKHQTVEAEVLERERAEVERLEAEVRAEIRRVYTPSEEKAHVR